MALALSAGGSTILRPVTFLPGPGTPSARQSRCRVSASKTDRFKCLYLRSVSFSELSSAELKVGGCQQRGPSLSGVRTLKHFRLRAQQDASSLPTAPSSPSRERPDLSGPTAVLEREVQSDPAHSIETDTAPQDEGTASSSSSSSSTTTTSPPPLSASTSAPAAAQAGSPVDAAPAGAAEQSGAEAEAAEQQPEAPDASWGEEDSDLELEAGYKMKGVCDKLIEIFWIEKPEPDQWRKLLAYSEEWAKIRPHFHARIQARAKEHKDPGKQAELFRLARRLKDVRFPSLPMLPLSPRPLSVQAAPLSTLSLSPRPPLSPMHPSPLHLPPFLCPSLSFLLPLSLSPSALLLSSPILRLPRLLPPSVCLSSLSHPLSPLSPSFSLPLPFLLSPSLYVAHGVGLTSKGGSRSSALLARRSDSNSSPSVCFSASLECLRGCALVTLVHTG